MAKRSQRRPVRYEKDQLGCMWGLISMFDFRQGRSTQRLLSDRRRASRHVAGAGSPVNKLDTSIYYNENCPETDGEERTTAAADAGKPSVKKLIEEEMFSDQDIKKEKNNGDVQPTQSISENGSHKKKNRRRIKKNRSRSCDSIRDLDVAGSSELECPCHQNSGHRLGNSLDIDNIMQQFCHQMHQKSKSCAKHDQPAEANAQLNPKSPDIAEKLSEAIKSLISQKLLDRKHLAADGDIHSSKELMDVLQILSSDEELFLKFSQDPNSLLAKYIQHEKDNKAEEDEDTKSLAGSNFSDGELSNVGRSDKLANRKHRNFFRRKVKSQGSNQLKDSETSQSSNKIVILKPGPTALCNSETESSLHLSPDSRNSSMNKEPNERVRSLFFLAELKRRLKNAMGKEQQKIPSDVISKRFPSGHQNLSNNDGSLKENAGRNSLTKNHFFVERIARPSSGVKKGEKTDDLKGEKTDKLKGHELGKDHDTSGHPRQRVSNIYVEAKKHLSEMLSDGDENGVISSKQLPKTLGRILSLPEYNSSPFGSPVRNWEHSFVTAQMRFSASNEFEEVNENAESTTLDNHVNPEGQTTQKLEPQSFVADDTADKKVQVLGSVTNITDETTHDDGADNNCCSLRDEMSSEGDVSIVEVTEILVQEENNVLDAHLECSGCSITGDDRTVDASESFDEQCYSKCAKEDSYEENKMPSSPLASPSNSSLGKKTEDCESAADMLERPSPVSVLEPLFMEDDISPASTRSQSVDSPVRSLQIQFEEFDSLVADQVLYSKTWLEGNEPVFEYVKAVLQASGLNWDELYMKSISSEQLLDPSLINGVEFFPNQLRHDQKLLFDCINEVLTEVYGHYFGSSPWVSFIKPNIRPIPSMKHAIREVWEGVNWHIIPLLLPRNLDQIVKKDMAKSGTWMDLRFDAESIGFDMGEAILEDLMEDTIVSCVNQHEVNECPVNLAELGG